ncbi:M15 family metallopeptidase [Jonesia denitrificans]|uniref:Peptidase M15B and M15C DD-carboxypeptidase VanY/endolysin n=1 Tax=Jonesia denitrificans (strain ATCC 14870 / DSM 20603 / BCRC 15368 / CIP 55.134 / JCM 11481 / NBRC 15587 / NCTC 10816 / Prevot 55134) TaxID=471856 RepID=C7R5C0_JONDD|nr:M15 family metallopeptidase [Jonesia denitrificans]ACV07798.1 peptidase M15B and M15C DD-carboxypeptidase VanY/endolysin [Jonesia denitrificans DSM 20603]SQH19771.1 D-alanyl-D-alanine carboxypeptidase [Jonesia denitrificans]
MDGIAAISQRMMEIQTRINTISAPLAAPTQATATSASASGVTGTTAASALGALTGGTQGASFDTLLTQAITQAGGATATGTTTQVAAPAGPAPTWNAQGVPADLARYGNGKIPRDALTSVGNTGHKLWAPAGASLEKLLDAAARDGVNIGITDSYRPIDVQHDLVRRKGLYSQGGLAAAPGTSPHGWGIAVDLKLDSAAQAWMREHGGKYGFVEDTPREPWHWVYSTGRSGR